MHAPRKGRGRAAAPPAAERRHEKAPPWHSPGKMIRAGSQCCWRSAPCRAPPTEERPAPRAQKPSRPHCKRVRASTRTRPEGGSECECVEESKVKSAQQKRNSRQEDETPFDQQPGCIEQAARATDRTEATGSTRAVAERTDPKHRAKRDPPPPLVAAATTLKERIIAWPGLFRKSAMFPCDARRRPNEKVRR